MMTAEQKRAIVGEATILADKLLEQANLSDAARFSMKQYLLSNIPVKDSIFDPDTFTELCNNALETGGCIPFMANKTSQTCKVVIHDKFGNIKHQEQSTIEVIR